MGIAANSPLQTKNSCTIPKATEQGMVHVTLNFPIIRAEKEKWFI
jgi:hypothetical protein